MFSDKYTFLIRKPIFFVIVLFIILFFPSSSGAATATNEPIATSSEVLVVYNTNITTVSDAPLCGSTQESLCLANYYKTARNIPAVNVLGIAASTTNGADVEEITRNDYNSGIKTPIENYLSTATSSDDGTLLKNKIKYIVLMKGIPLKIVWNSVTGDMGAGQDEWNNSNHTGSSVDAAVNLLFQTYDLHGDLVNPYYNVDPNFTGTYRFKSNFFSGPSGPTVSYLTTRLDGQSVADVKGMIDRSLAADTSGQKYFVLDADNSSTLFGNANSTLLARGFKTIFDATSAWINSAWITASSTGSQPIIAYDSNGNNSSPNKMPADLYTSVLSSSLYAPGAVSSTYESYNARSVTTGGCVSHSCISSFIAAGGSGGVGNVYEPFGNTVAYQSIFMPAYALGYTWADAAYMSLPYMDWQQTVIGDPLMTIYRKPFVPTVTSQQSSDSTFSTSPNFSWTSVLGYYPISKYQLYIDNLLNRDNLVSTSTTPASSLSYGLHTWYVTAVDSFGQVATSSINNLYVNQTASSPSSDSTVAPSFVKQIVATSSKLYNIFPKGLGLDSSGNVYVADYNSNNIQKFDSSGNLISQFGSTGSGNGQFGVSTALTGNVVFDSSGNMYVADPGNSRIEKFDSSGNYVTQWGGVGTGNGQFAANSPTNIAISTSTGSLYAADAGNIRVEKFDLSGNYITKWGNFASPFIAIQGIATDYAGNVYTSDGRFDSKVLKFDSSGNLLSTLISGNGTSAGKFGSSMPELTVDSSGNIYIADMYNYRIQKFDSAGNYLSQFGSMGAGNGQFYTISGLAVDSSGNIYVSDSANKRVQKFDSSGNYITEWGSGNSDNGRFSFINIVARDNNSNNAVVDKLGNLYVSDTFNNRIQKFDSSGNYITKWGSAGTGNGQFATSSPMAIAVDSSNNIYVSDRLNNRVEKFDSSGNYITQWGTAGSGNGQFSASKGPGGIAVDSSNNVYVADMGNYRIQKFDSSGNYITKWGSSGTGNVQFNAVSGLAVDASDNVYAADSGNHRIQKFDSSGNYITQWGSTGVGNGQFSSTYGPGGITVDSSGYVYVTDPGNSRVERFDSSGTYLAQWGSAGISDGQFGLSVSPVAVAVFGNNIYVVDSYNNRISQFLNYVSPVSVPSVVHSSGGGGGGGGGNLGSPVTVLASVVTSPKVVYTVPVFSPILFKTDLSVNTNSQDVKLLQNFLNSHGFIISTKGAGSPGNETTFFGSATKAALIKFQLTNGIIPASGLLGPITRNLIAKLTASSTSSTPTIIPTQTSDVSKKELGVFTQSLQLNSTGPSVKLLQQFLNSHGFPVASSGIGSIGNESTFFGPATKAALIQFQKANNITPSEGYFGPKTIKVIESLD